MKIKKLFRWILELRKYDKFAEDLQKVREEIKPQQNPVPFKNNVVNLPITSGNAKPPDDYIDFGRQLSLIGLAQDMFGDSKNSETFLTDEPIIGNEYVGYLTDKQLFKKYPFTDEQKEAYTEYSNIVKSEVARKRDAIIDQMDSELSEMKSKILAHVAFLEKWILKVDTTEMYDKGLYQGAIHELKFLKTLIK